MSKDHLKSKIIPWTLCAILVLLMISMALLAFHNRSKRWEVTRSAIEANGHSLDWRDYIRPRLQENENFLALEVMTEEAFPDQLNKVNEILKEFMLVDYYSGLDNDPHNFRKRLASRMQVQPEDLDEDLWPYFNDLIEPYQAYAQAIIQATEERPSGQAIGEYQLPFEVPIIKFSLTRGWVSLLGAYTLQALKEGDSESAFRGLKAILVIAKAESPLPMLVDTMIRTVLLKRFVVPLFIDGLVNNVWTDEQLEWFEYAFAQFDLVGELELAMIAERASVIGSMTESEHTRDSYGIAKVLLESNLRVYVEAMTEVLDAYFDNGSVNPNGILVYDQIERDLGFEAEGIGRLRVFFKNSQLASMAMPGINQISMQHAEVQSYIDMAIISCALIRFQHDNNEYPSSLSALIPAYIDSIPRGRVSGIDYHYEQLDDGASFKLWSVGWNETNDAGKVVVRTNKREYQERFPKEGDWVWPYPQWPEVIKE